MNKTLIHNRNFNLKNLLRIPVSSAATRVSYCWIYIHIYTRTLFRYNIINSAGSRSLCVSGFGLDTKIHMKNNLKSTQTRSGVFIVLIVESLMFFLLLL